MPYKPILFFIAGFLLSQFMQLLLNEQNHSNENIKNTEFDSKISASDYLSQEKYVFSFLAMQNEMKLAEKESKSSGWSTEVHSGSIDSRVIEATALESADSQWYEVLTHPKIEKKYKEDFLAFLSWYVANIRPEQYGI